MDSAGAYESFLEAAKCGDVAQVERGLEKNDPRSCDSEALRLAVKRGRLDVVELLLPLSDPCAGRPNALSLAAKNGNVEMFKAILPAVEGIRWRRTALFWATDQGRAEIVALLLATKGLEDVSDSVLSDAARRGHKNIVELLWPLYEEKPGEFIEMLRAERMDASEYASQVESKLLSEAVLVPEKKKAVGRI